MLDDKTATIEGLYRAFNARDIDAAMSHIAPGADWPDGSTGGRVHGRDALRAYWLKQWSSFNPRVAPMRIELAPDGSAHVRVDQLIKALDGSVLVNRQVEQVFEFEGPFIRRMTTVVLPKESDDDDED